MEFADKTAIRLITLPPICEADFYNGAYSAKIGSRVKLPEDGKLLRIFLGESDTWEGKPLYEQIVIRARELKMAGATVVRGLMGFGAKSHMHTAKILELSQDMPMIIEIVDTQKNIDKLMPFLDEAMKECLITLEDIKVIKYQSDGA